MDLVVSWILELPHRYVVKIVGCSSATVVDWFGFCREICTEVVSLDRLGQMTGTKEQPIQIDEARFAGRRKYNKGRLLEGDQPPESTDSEADVRNQRNHGRRIDGPWVFGLRQGLDARFFVVERRDKDTLIPIIQEHCAVRSYVYSDEWRSYSTLTTKGFRHATVCHQENFVDPVTGVHTQLIERTWLDAKVKILKKQRGVPLKNLQSHLDEVSWRIRNLKSEDLLTTFLQSVAEVYNE